MAAFSPVDGDAMSPTAISYDQIASVKKTLFLDEGDDLENDALLKPSRQRSNSTATTRSARSTTTFDETEPQQVNSDNTDGKDMLNVLLRIRPFTKEELSAGENQDVLQTINPNEVILAPPKLSKAYKAAGNNKTRDNTMKFTFNQIFDSDTTQKTLFDDTTLPLVRDLFEGKNSLLFTYGITNSGKSYTILVRAKTD
jgi:kinesin family member 20